MLKEKNHKTRYLYLLLSPVSFLIGAVIYLLFRSTDLYMFAAIKSLPIYGRLEVLRRSCSDVTLPAWLVYNVPDGLWLFAYLLLMEAIWFRDRGRMKALFLWIMPVLAVAAEFLQMWNPSLGTGDVWDVAAYGIAVILFLTIKYKVV